uniref:Uncharacterized protein n=1 Tax=Gossypium raimondii TaxID=29730 RepID=A0A0D2NEB2_GOSRA|nr:hypothetical protein B456_005G170700 [Gossypium raimondii]
MKSQLYCITIARVVYLKVVDLLASLMKKNCLFCILSPIPLLPRDLCNRSDHIDIPSTQHKSLKGSRRLTKVRKPRSLKKWIPIR